MKSQLIPQRTPKRFDRRKVGCPRSRNALFDVILAQSKMPFPSEASTSRSASPIITDRDRKANDDNPASTATFESLGVIPPLLEALAQMKFSKPTDIQAQAIPHALQGRDVIGVAETVSNSASHEPPLLGCNHDLVSLLERARGRLPRSHYQSYKNSGMNPRDCFAAF